MVTSSLRAPNISPATAARKWRTRLQLLGVVLISAAIGSLTLLAHGGDERAWYAAAENVLRFSALIFLGFFVSGSLSYFLRAPRSIGTGEQTLLFAFVGSYLVYLAFIVARVLLTDARTPAETLTFCVFAAIAPSVLAASGYHRRKRPTAGWEILRRAAVIYFWLILALDGLGHFYGPHRPDDYYGLLLVLLTGGFLMRLVAAIGRRFAPPMPAASRVPL